MVWQVPPKGSSCLAQVIKVIQVPPYVEGPECRDQSAEFIVGTGIMRRPVLSFGRPSNGTCGVRTDEAELKIDHGGCTWPSKCADNPVLDGSGQSLGTRLDDLMASGSRDP